jgi:hypothetical protein
MGTGNVAVGLSALYTNEDGYSNTAVGYEALAGNVASENTAIGYQAMNSNVLGTANVAVGQTALSANTDGGYNTAIGWDAMKEAQGSNNVAVGMSALKYNGTGDGNVAIGGDALQFCIDGSNNTMVGTRTDFADPLMDDISNSTALGHDARVTASDQMRLGNNNIQTLFCMGAFNGTIAGVAPNLYVDSTGQIMRVTGSGGPLNPGLRSNPEVDLPQIPVGSSVKVNFNVPGAKTGQVVQVSPSDELPDGLVIAYSRVVTEGSVEVKFLNYSQFPLDPLPMTFHIAILP